MIIPDQDGSYATAMSLYNNGDYKRALPILEQFAEAGSIEASRLLGNIYAFGLGVKKNIATAYEHYSMAASKGDEEAIFSCAQITYLRGDALGAFEQFESSAKEGFLPSIFWCGWLLIREFNSGGSDRRKGLSYISLAAKRGHVKAMGFKFRLCLKREYGFRGVLIAPYLFAKILIIGGYLYTFTSREDNRLLY